MSASMTMLGVFSQRQVSRLKRCVYECARGIEHGKLWRFPIDVWLVWFVVGIPVSVDLYTRGIIVSKRLVPFCEFERSGSCGKTTYSKILGFHLTITKVTSWLNTSQFCSPSFAWPSHRGRLTPEMPTAATLRFFRNISTNEQRLRQPLKRWRIESERTKVRRRWQPPRPPPHRRFRPIYRSTHWETSS